jgi:CRP-like cAMP-binding protein
MKHIHEDLCACMQGEHSIFSFLDENHLRELSDLFECRDLSAGEVLWREGDTCDYMAFVVSGRVEVKKNTEFEGKEVIVGVYGKGGIVGALCILDGSPRAVTAVALDDVRLAIISQQNFNKLIEMHPESGIKLMRGMLLSVSIRLRKSFERLATFF